MTLFFSTNVTKTFDIVVCTCFLDHLGSYFGRLGAALISPHRFKWLFEISFHPLVTLGRATAVLKPPLLCGIRRSCGRLTLAERTYFLRSQYVARRETGAVQRELTVTFYKSALRQSTPLHRDALCKANEKRKGKGHWTTSPRNKTFDENRPLILIFSPRWFLIDSYQWIVQWHVHWLWICESNEFVTWATLRLRHF